MSDGLRVMLAVPKDGVFRGVATGFTRAALGRNWLLMLKTQAELSDIHMFNPQVIVVHSDNKSLSDHARRESRLVVGVEAACSAFGVPTLGIDDTAVGRVAAEYFLERRIRSVGVYGLTGHPWAASRAEGFCNVVEAEGGVITNWAPGHVLAPDSNAWAGGLLEWIARMPKPAGILACCDNWGMALLADLRLHGVRVPEDVSVLGVDNDAFICELGLPPLSSVALPWERMGQEAAAVVDRALTSGAHPTCQLLGPVGIVTRRSSDMMAVADPMVAKGMAFIRQNAHRPIGVPDVVEHIPTYRRGLEQRFRKQLGRTVMEEIRRARVEIAKHLLAATDLEMLDVAARCGFSGPAQFSIAIRRETGQTPTEYRRKNRL